MISGAKFLRSKELVFSAKLRTMETSIPTITRPWLFCHLVSVSCWAIKTYSVNVWKQHLWPADSECSYTARYCQVNKSCSNENLSMLALSIINQFWKKTVSWLFYTGVCDSAVDSVIAFLVGEGLFWLQSFALQTAMRNTKIVSRSSNALIVVCIANHGQCLA